MNSLCNQAEEIGVPDQDISTGASHKHYRGQRCRIIMVKLHFSRSYYGAFKLQKITYSNVLCTRLCVMRNKLLHHLYRISCPFFAISCTVQMHSQMRIGLDFLRLEQEDMLIVKG